MLGSLLFVCINVLGYCQPLPPIDDAPPDAQMRAFLKAVDDQNAYPQDWKTLENKANSAGIGDGISLSNWKRLLEMSRTSGLRARGALELHPCLKKRVFFDELIHALGHDSDLFTRARVFLRMKEMHESDPECPRFGLLLLLECWNEPWPEGINLHGNEPRDVLLLYLEKQWRIPPGKLTPELCGKLLSKSKAWVYDKKAQCWTIPGSENWLPTFAP